MRLVSGLLWSLYKIAVIYTLLAYALVYWTPSAHWAAGFVMLSLPVMLVFHVVFLVVWALISPKRLLTTLFVLALGYPFLARTVQFGFSQDETISGTRPENTLKVLNYNVYKFNMFAFRAKEDTLTIRATRQWLTGQDADVLCFQEFYHYDHIPELDFRRLLRKAGYRYEAFQLNEYQGDSPYRNGLAVFSRFPIVARRDTSFTNQNGLVEVDIAWRNTTVRIIDVHLYSMTLNLSDVAAQRQYDGLKRETGATFRLMRRGFSQRSKETQVLEKWIADSPHPVIVCGDFNETPYSYVYGRLRKRLHNAFEEKGNGFGFTYNRLPYFIRIDNQFFDQGKLELLDFKTLDEIPYSDHYPLVGRYQIK
ncbi:endonuclease/exonuclease/phosphatase family protein [Persicitalea sp.]|uniref:endonuclease/exonuclease/phosphatase family protein n=1 Tax=Persicitalea sp. TaxID=3100273 RepID=UPI003593AA33